MKKLAIAILGLLFALNSSVWAVTETFVATLDGLQENPDVATSGTGMGTAIYDSDANTLAVDLTFSGLSSNTNNAHIHCCAPAVTENAGVAIDFPSVGFPLGVTSGSFSHTFNLGQTSTYSGAYLTASGGTADGARDRLLNSMRGQTGGNLGVAYFNIHTANFGPGEIRGNLSLVPEPTAMFLMVMGAIPFVARRWRP